MRVHIIINASIMHSRTLHSPAIMYSKGKDYLDKFDPRSFLKRYDVVRDGQAEHILRCFHEAFQTVPDNVKVLDYGAGPSLIPSIAAASKASEIVLAEYVESNRKVLREWLDGDPAAYDWTPHFNYVVGDLEGKGEEEVAVRQEKVRNTVKAVVHCDFTQDPIIESSYNVSYDVVASSLVLVSASETYEQFVEFMCHLGKLVKTGGSLLLYSVKDFAHQYTVGNYTFESLHVTIEEVESAMNIAGFQDLQKSETFTPQSEPFFHFYFIRGVKKM